MLRLWTPTIFKEINIIFTLIFGGGWLKLGGGGWLKLGGGTTL
jgi:hypothetical protein